MEDFSQLLNQYVRRSGISDAELARTVGVSRQTIFRWREGVTGRPRHREDVLALARKLRLTPEERDELLLAAGFRPEATGQESIGAEEQTAKTGVELKPPVGKDDEAEAPVAASSPNRWLVGVGVGMLLLLAAGGLFWWLDGGQTGPNPANIATVSPVSDVAKPATLAVADQGVVLVTHFANYAGSQVGYNVAGRLAEALQREVDDARFQPHLRILIWPEVVGERQAALQAGQEMNATLVIYGEYDVGRVVVKFAHPADQADFTEPAVQHAVQDVPDLSAKINSDLPRQVRSLALMALGQIYLDQGAAGQARSLLLQARDNLQGDPTVDEQTWALANFLLGIAYHHNDPPTLDGAIAAYSEAIRAWPQMISSRLNRSAAYATRHQPGDLQLALADAEAVVSAEPDWAPAYNNLASIRIALGDPDNLALAVEDSAQALTLEPSLPEAYFNRAYAEYRLGMAVSNVAPDLEQALVLRPDYGAALNLFCWAYAVEQQPEQALPYCRQAVAVDPRPVYFDSRGLAYAQLGDYQAAIADFQTFVIWLEQQPAVDRTQLTRRQAWIEVLQSGRNPFTPGLLAELRHEFE